MLPLPTHPKDDLHRDNLTYYLLPTTYYLLPTTYYLLPTTYHLPPTTYHLPPTTCYLLPTTNHLLPTTYYLLPTRQQLGGGMGVGTWSFSFWGGLLRGRFLPLFHFLRARRASRVYLRSFFEDRFPHKLRVFDACFLTCQLIKTT